MGVVVLENGEFPSVNSLPLVSFVGQRNKQVSLEAVTKQSGFLLLLLLARPSSVLAVRLGTKFWILA